MPHTATRINNLVAPDSARSLRAMSGSDVCTTHSSPASNNDERCLSRYSGRGRQRLCGDTKTGTRTSSLMAALGPTGRFRSLRDRSRWRRVGHVNLDKTIPFKCSTDCTSKLIWTMCTFNIIKYYCYNTLLSYHWLLLHSWRHKCLPTSTIYARVRVNVLIYRHCT